MLFKRDHIAMIKAGTKTQTRRTGKKRWNVGSVQPVKVDYYSKPEAWVRILSVHEEPLGAITEADARREGYSSINSYKAAWERIYKQPWPDALLVQVVSFCLVHKDRHQQTTLFDSEGRPDQEGVPKDKGEVQVDDSDRPRG